MATLPQDVFCLMSHAICFKDLNYIWIQWIHLLYDLVLLQHRIFHELIVINHIYIYQFPFSFREKIVTGTKISTEKKKLVS